MFEAKKQKVESSKNINILLKWLIELSDEVFPIMTKGIVKRTMSRKATMIPLPSMRFLRTTKVGQMMMMMTRIGTKLQITRII
jgi:hypothetical protein